MLVRLRKRYMVSHIPGARPAAKLLPASKNWVCMEQDCSIQSVHSLLAATLWKYVPMKYRKSIHFQMRSCLRHGEIIDKMIIQEVKPHKVEMKEGVHESITVAFE